MHWSQYLPKLVQTNHCHTEPNAGLPLAVPILLILPNNVYTYRHKLNKATDQFYMPRLSKFEIFFLSSKNFWTLKVWFSKNNEHETPPTWGSLRPIQASFRTYWKIEKTAFLEMAANIHSPFGPILADFSAYVLSCTTGPGGWRFMFIIFAESYFQMKCDMMHTVQEFHSNINTNMHCVENLITSSWVFTLILVYQS